MEDTDLGRDLAAVTHIFTIDAPAGGIAGARPEDALDLHRFTSNLRDRPDLGIRVVDLGVLQGMEIATEKGVVPVGDLWVTAWLDHFGIGQVHMSHRSATDSETIAGILDHLCHGRTTLTFDGTPFLRWIAEKAGWTTVPTLAQDVLDFVHLPSHRLPDLISSDRPTSDALRIVYRNPHSPITTASGVRMPADLNRGDVSFAAHGRGVVLLCGHTKHRQIALRLTAAELLFAIGRARQSREILEHRLRDDRWRSAGTGTHFDQAFLQELTDTVRRERIRLAVDVVAAVDGLFLPESVLDDFRSSLAAALRFEEVTDSSQSLANTLSEVATSYLEEARVAVAAAVAARERRWQVIVGVSSGIALPIALLLSYFGVASEVNAPPAVSIFDLRHHWPAYLVTALSIVAIVTTSLLSYHRARRRIPSRGGSATG